MKRKSSGSGLYFAIGIVVIGASAAAGYYLYGAHSGAAPSTSVSTNTTVAQPAEVAPTPAPVAPGPVQSAGKYVAPGAPPVMIAELKSTPVPEKTDPDPEASQTGTPAVASATITDQATTDPSSTPPVPTSTSTDVTSDSANPPAPTSPPATDANPAPPTVIAPAPDQSVPSTTVSNPTPVAAGPLYCVEAGTFSSEKNAKTMVDNLRVLGFDASSLPTDSTNTAFRVQVGAFHNKPAADSAVTTLQKQGYPAYIVTK